ncbi:MAG: glycosyltransferase N-terminal domain-containing protein, partial [Candidatus Neomarinimicrobiota bacterium]|nr:glycosyltransferase N-terminal domain-containing protein [Candidatus Neomarinimicrobiota bacterium]
HVSSHGEFLQTKPVLQGLKEVEPCAKIIVSFFSPSGYNHVDDESIDCKIYLPLDFYWTVKSVLRLVRPEKLILQLMIFGPILFGLLKNLEFLQYCLQQGLKKKQENYFLWCETFIIMFTRISTQSILLLNLITII